MNIQASLVLLYHDIALGLLASLASSSNSRCHVLIYMSFGDVSLALRSKAKLKCSENRLSCLSRTCRPAAASVKGLMAAWPSQ